MSDLLKDKSEWMLVGHFGVDAGLCWIGDPCYVIHNEEGLPSTLGKNWGDFCDKLHDMNHGAKSFNYARGHEGLGVCVTTGFGDGNYPVYARLQEGRVAQLFIDFFGDGAPCSWGFRF